MTPLNLLTARWQTLAACEQAAAIEEAIDAGRDWARRIGGPLLGDEVGLAYDYYLMFTYGTVAALLWVRENRVVRSADDPRLAVFCAQLSAADADISDNAAPVPLCLLTALWEHLTVGERDAALTLAEGAGRRAARDGEFPVDWAAGQSDWLEVLLSFFPGADEDAVDLAADDPRVVRFDAAQREEWGDQPLPEWARADRERTLAGRDLALAV